MFRVNERAIILLNSAGFGTNLLAWVADNPAFVSNMLLFAIPTAIYTILKGRQKLKQNAEIHELEMMRKRQEMQQDQDIHNAKYHKDEH